LQELFSLNDELLSYANNTDSIRQKILSQNEVIKQLVGQIESINPNNKSYANSSNEVV